MPVKLSNTSDHQRCEEMFIHLTPKGAVVPYSLCKDEDGNYWVAAKGGLFKFNQHGDKVLFERKNDFPKKISAYCQVLNHNKTVIFFVFFSSYNFKPYYVVHAFAEDQQCLTELRIFDLDGHILHEQFIDGKIQSLAVTSEGEVFSTKQMQGEDSIISKMNLDCPLGWEEVISEDEYAFQTLCVYDSNTLVVSTCSLPINMYSKQFIRIIDIPSRKIVRTFSSSGKKDGEVYFPRSIKRYKDGILVLDKTGRIQEFSLSGEFVRTAAQIDAYLGNGFIVSDEEAIIACSGIVVSKEQESICDDWIEKIALDGSKWVPRPVKIGENES
ncbi:unnamed protein product [Enterobius vermicularis]|uniref:SGL domain-containing protein n=1 Tax=Enterobius vermicularis TaxID=51028 RepID=A0A0N4VHB3_ENTVE|nr:unnamed protein product [Enterobius vermicularis]